MSTDPAHSLGDALGVRLSPRVTRAAPRLDAVELDAARAFARWIADHHAAAADVLQHGTWLDRDDVDALLDLPIPGIDELIALIEIDRLARRGYERVVIDTAPTGHTLRLIAAPDAVRALAGILESMQAEHRIVREQLARVARADAADRLVDAIAAQAAAVAARLRDTRQTSFTWVTLPEPMAVAESEDALAALAGAHVAVDEIVVNRVLTDEGPCPVCDRRRADERAIVARIRRTIGRGRRVTLVAAQPAEPRGSRALARLAREMAHGSPPDASGRPPRRPAAAISRNPDPSAPRADPASLPAIRGARLVFVGGKGGVGKTTVAATVAVSLARERSARRVLLLSTDPAHSLSDVFASAIGDRPVGVPDAPTNLFVREVDAAAALASRRRDVDAALAEIAGSVATDAAGAGADDLVELAPPGIDELFGLLSVFDARADYDVVVVDTAPTGHALRLLEMPETARAWVQLLLTVLLKYRALVRPGKLAAELVQVSKSIRDFQALLHDADATRFLVVTRAARLPRRETERLVARLRKLRLHVAAIVVNAMTLAPGRCRRCRRTRAAEQRELGPLRRAAGRRGIIRTPLSAPSPRGVLPLERWARAWLA